MQAYRDGVGGDTEDETVGEVVDRKTQDERPQRVLVNMFLGSVVRVRTGERFGQEQEDESSNETRYRSSFCELEAFGEEIDEG